MTTRAGELVNLGRILRDLAVKEDLAVVVANQVLDRFEEEGDDFYVDQFTHLPPDHKNPSSPSLALDERAGITPNASQARPALSQPANPLTPVVPKEPPSSAPSALTFSKPNLLSLNHQQRFFTGWGDRPPDTALRTEDIIGGLKTPALGLLWTSQIACRIVLKKRSALIPTPVAAVETTGQSSLLNIQPQQLGSQPSSTSGGLSSLREQGEPAEAPSDATVPMGTGQKAETKDFGKDPNYEFPDTQSEYPEYEPSQEPTTRTMKVVFAPWTSGRLKKETSRKADDDPEWGGEVEFEIWKGGIRAVE